MRLIAVSEARIGRAVEVLRLSCPEEMPAPIRSHAKEAASREEQDLMGVNFTT
jgi:hypothetical protein